MPRPTRLPPESSLDAKRDADELPEEEDDDEPDDEPEEDLPDEPEEP
ncbi:MAG: hypothetical protein ABIQ42_05105 [Rhodoferax sp.]